MEKKKHSTGVGCFCFNKIIKSTARKPLALWFHVGDLAPRDRDGENFVFTLQSLQLHCLLWCRYTNQKSARVQEGSGSPILPLLWGNKEFLVTPGLTFKGSLQAGVRKSQFKQPLFEVARVESRQWKRVWSLFGLAWKKKWLHLKFPTTSVTVSSYTCTSACPSHFSSSAHDHNAFWLLKFNAAFTVAFSILTQFFFPMFRLLLHGETMATKWHQWSTAMY